MGGIKGQRAKTHRSGGQLRGRQSPQTLPCRDHGPPGAASGAEGGPVGQGTHPTSTGQRGRTEERGQHPSKCSRTGVLLGERGLWARRSTVSICPVDYPTLNVTAQGPSCPPSGTAFSSQWAPDSCLTQGALERTQRPAEPARSCVHMCPVAQQLCADPSGPCASFISSG